jgi:hypothetical protein
MKKIFGILISIILVGTSFGQDTIKKQNQSELVNDFTFSYGMAMVYSNTFNYSPTSDNKYTSSGTFIIDTLVK